MAVELQCIESGVPHKKQILHIVKVLQRGGIIVYPTDTIYGLGADIYNKSAIEKIIKIKKISSNKLFSLICPDFQSISKWAHIPNHAFRVMKRVLPGKYTFILPVSTEVPKKLINKRNTVGIRIPDSPIAISIVKELGRPIINTSVPKSKDEFFTDPMEIAEMYKYDIDLIVSSGIMPNIPSTIVDYTTNPPEIIRHGAGDINSLF